MQLRRRAFALFLLGACLAALIGNGYAQKAPPEHAAVHKPAGKADPDPDAGDGAFFAQALARASDPEEKKLEMAKTEYAIWTLEHARTAYEWQHLSTVIIFFVVVVLVLSGVGFSWMQFRAAHHQPMQEIAKTVTSAKANQALGDEGVAQLEIATAEKESVTEFSASPHGIKVASSAIGVVILVISMCFFYLYLAYVYPISVITADQASRPASAVNAIHP